jgi:hypothetical protein
MYMIATCAFFWNFRENVNVMKDSLLKMSNSIFIDWKFTKYSVSSTFLYNGNSKCYVVRILYAISFQWSTCFGYRGQQIIWKLTITDKILEKTLMFWRILCWKCPILSSLIEHLLNIKTYTVIFGMQISHLSNGQHVLAIGDSRLFGNWLSLTADVGNREQQWHEFLFLVYPVISWAISV